MLYLSIKSLKHLCTEFVISPLQELERSRFCPEGCSWLPFRANGCASRLQANEGTSQAGGRAQLGEIPALPSLPATGEHCSLGQFCKGLHTSMTLCATLRNKLRTTPIPGKRPTKTPAPTLNSSHTPNSPIKNNSLLIFFLNGPIIFLFASPSLLHASTYLYIRALLCFSYQKDAASLAIWSLGISGPESTFSMWNWVSTIQALSEMKILMLGIDLSSMEAVISLQNCCPQCQVLNNTERAKLKALNSVSITCRSVDEIDMDIWVPHHLDHTLKTTNCLSFCWAVMNIFSYMHAKYYDTSKGHSS